MGCHIDADASSADDRGEVFGYENLYIADGSIVTASLELIRHARLELLQNELLI